MSNQIGAIELYDCISKQNNELLDWCVQYLNKFMIKILMAVIILICSIYLFIAKRKPFYHTSITRKQIILLILIADMLCIILYKIVYLSYQLGVRLPWLYFPIPYFQFMFICYIIYYFGRKSILLGIFNQQNTNYEISSNMQLKLSQLMHTGLVFFFSVVFLLNYIDYFLHSDNYSLCQAQFFNIITTVGFLLQGLFLLQIRQLTRQVNKNMRQDLLQSGPRMDFTNIVTRRLKNIWLLVIINIIGSCVSFLQNIYFVIMNEILINSIKPYTCYYVNIPNDPELTNLINSIIDFLDKLFSFFLPYFFALIILWPGKNEKDKYQSESQEVLAETYVIANGTSGNSDQTITSD